ncbi:MAG: hypothetical protein QXW70_01790 [Candidatus Anstonellales archaeon]
MNTYKLSAGALLASIAFLFQIGNDVLGVQTGFGMTVDLVGVPILVAFFILGYETALYVAVLVAMFITFFAASSYIGAFMKFAATIPSILVPAAYLISAKKTLDFGKMCGLVCLCLLALVGLVGLGTHLTDLSGKIIGHKSLWIGLIPIFIVAVFSYIMLLIWRRYEKAVDVNALSKIQYMLFVLITVVIVRGLLMIVANFYFAGPIFFKMSSEEFIALVEGVNFLWLGKGVAWYLVIFFWNAIQAAVEFVISWMIAYKFGLVKMYSE